MPGTRSLRRERAILVGLCPSKRDRFEVEEHLEELGELAETAGAVVVGSTIQDRGPIDPSTLIRRGRVSQLAELAREKNANLVLFDNDLSPAQARNLEKALPVRVLDRSTLILDIFARRARSREARTQVELARLRYLLPRLTRRWGHLSRQDGGIGQRGVGEKQLEIDRRLVRHRIGRLASDLKRIELERGERRKGRSGASRVALIGYTNAGKSTLFNLLTGAGAFVEDRLFATLDPLVRRCEHAGGPPFLVIDTVGFIRKLPHHLVASFRSTLEEAVDANLLLQVVDTSSHALEDHLRTTDVTLRDLDLSDRPRLLVFNKIDRAPEGLLSRLRTEHPEAIFMSALDNSFVDVLAEAVRLKLGEDLIEETIAIPSDEPDLLARLCTLVRVMHSVVVDGHIEVRFRARPAQRARIARLLREAGVRGTEGGAS
ncbi:MAG: GTPase HflX [Acidobacteria bacterium]|nr:GTPase HflX [Acidobacteriota bacterium]